MRHGTGLGRLLAALATTAALIFVVGQAGAANPSATTYTVGTPQLATIANGSSAAPWNLFQGDSAFSPYAPVLPYTPGGATTSTGGVTEPNLAVYPAATSTDTSVPYASGVVGTPGPLDDYCGSGNNAAESSGSPARQPAGTTLPLAPAYFPHIVRNADGSLTGYFDYRPKDADEAIVAAHSTDGVNWTYQGEALEQNQGSCPTADLNDDGNGHPNVLTIGGTSRLYTLQRAAGDNVGVGMLVHTLDPTASNPLNGVPAAEKVGVDPDDFASASVTINGTAQPISLQNANGSGPEQLYPGPFVDLTPSQSAVFSCSGVTAPGVTPASLTGCTTASGSVSIGSGDLIEQVIATVNAGIAAAAPSTACSTGNPVPSTTGTGKLPCEVTPGPGAETGDGGLAGFTISGTDGTNPTNLTLTILNQDAPYRAYIDGVAIYCNQANALPTGKLEDCTTGPNGPTLTVNAGDPITADPIIPAGAQQTSGLVAPDGIVGVVPGYPGVPAGSTAVMYTEKVLNFFDFAYTTESGSTSFANGMTITFTMFPNTDPVGACGNLVCTLLGSGPSYTFSIGDDTHGTIVTETCTGVTVNTGVTPNTGSFTGCSGGPTNGKFAKNSYLGAPGAATAPVSTLSQIGEGSSKGQKLLKNNEDLTILRVAYTSDGVNFSTAGLPNGGVISGSDQGDVGADGSVNCAADPVVAAYSGISDPCSSTSPPSLNAYGTPGTALATEMRWAGAAGSIIQNPDGTLGMFMSGAWAGDGDSDAFNQIWYSSSSDGGVHWSVPTDVISTDYTFSASRAQDVALAGGTDSQLGISAYYSGRAYGPSVVQNPNGTLTLVFAGYRLPSPVGSVGGVYGTNPAAQYTVGSTDPLLYRQILAETLTSSTSPGVATSVNVTTSAADPTYGTAVTYTATVSPTPPGTGLPTGTVAFTDNGSPISGCGSAVLADQSPDTATCTTTPGAGTHTIGATYSGDSNYAGTTGSTMQKVEKATLTVTAQDATVIFGQPTPAFTTKITGFVDNDPTSVVSGSASCTTTRTLASTAGPYPISCTVGMLAAANYTFAFVPGTLTVTDTRTISGAVHGPLKIASGEAVELAPGASVSGPVTIAAGASLDVEGASITGPLTGDGVGTVRICGATVSGPVTLTGAKGPIVIGDGTAHCSATTVTGPVTLTGNTGGVTVIGTTVGGPLRVENSSGGITVTNNKVGGPITVTGNTGTVIDKPNSSSGPAKLQ